MLTMKNILEKNRRLVCIVASLLLVAGFPLSSLSAPQGGEITSGSGSIQTPNAQTTVVNQQSQTLSINWQNLNLSADELLRFEQPNSEAAALNYILDQQPSEILGRIEANGRVFLMNPNGIVFGESALMWVRWWQAVYRWISIH